MAEKENGPMIISPTRVVGLSSLRVQTQDWDTRKHL